MTDILGRLNAVSREIGDMPVSAGAGRSMLLRRIFDAPVDEVWRACTDPDRIGRWLAPVAGDLRPGGTFQIEGDAGGEILRCEEPRVLKVTWVLGEGMPSEVEVRLSEGADGATAFELENASPAETVDQIVRKYGPVGPVGIGGGWDLTLLALDRYLRGEEFDAATWTGAPQVREFIIGSIRAWAAVSQDVWGSTDEEIDAVVAFTIQQFVPGAADGGDGG
ncbi:uncharacterized protein YndB with AHSA1/START domain [Murinocardiopsis flavida]|uniref:Uncharacterized protein YndB with AHSA1/START domain n=1 Tax=Murinocardiopsis flavida TaxID=645275 RepID=A0A2P8DSP2_9ACTN|nr:SRPBCC domain-containing protein [Murinocardiopsis flavida]PSL00230.1 uncharacterized protein YndB with AHSA1/START domain [Murinocardiopsis flavida]